MSDELKSRAGTPEADVSASEIARLKADLEQERVKSQRYRLAVESATNLIYEWDLGSRVEWIGQVDELLGYQPNEFPRTWEGYISLFHSEDRDRALAAIEKRLKSEEPYSVECRVRRKDGTYLYWQDWGTVVRDESGKPVKWLGVVSDITTRKRAEEVLRDSREELYRLLNSITEGAYGVDFNGNCTFVNQAFLQMLGYQNDHEFLGKHIHELIHHSHYDGSPYPSSECRMYRAHQTNQPIHVTDEVFWRKDGVAIPVEYWSHPIAKDGVVIGSIATFVDITERKKAEEKLRETLSSLRNALGGIFQVLSATTEKRDPYTAGHQKRVADLARAIGREMGLAAERVEGLRIAGTIHDVGKVSIPAEILSKPTRLTEIEFELIKSHPQIGHDILRDIDFTWPIAEMVLQHHERMNGSGYPRGLKGEDILLEARILAVSDVVEAMASHRPYRPALGIEAALEEIEKNKGILYDADVVSACLILFREKDFKFKL
jgi:PAS domain S-box-containing protein